MVKDKPKVSVLIPAYNAQEFIQRAISSVLRQTFADLELIVVDDGSRDRTGQIIRQMQKDDPRISYFYQENRGLANTRNRLVDLAGGEFIAFLDHDDEWLPEKIEKQLRLFEKDRKTGLVFCDIYLKNNGKIIATSFKERKPYRGYVFYEYLFSDNFATLSTVVLPKRVLLEFMPFNPEYEINEEFDVFLKIARNYKFDYIAEPLAVYHIHGNNTVMSNAKKMAEENLTILNDWIKNDPQIMQLHRGQLNRRLSQLYCKKALYFLEKKNSRQVIACIFKSFRYKLFNPAAMKMAIKLILNSLRITRC